MPFVSILPSETADLLQGAQAVGFDKMMYAIDVLDGDIDPPLEVMTSGLAPEFMNNYLGRLREDPLRRMVARGEIPVTNTPIAFENTPSSLSIAGNRRMTAGDTSQLRWFLSQGMRTGVSFRIRMPQGRCASLNFYSPFAHPDEDLAAAMQSLFLIGHQLHARMEPKLHKWRGTLLSGREVECLEWIAFGKSNREIAALLGLSIDTVKEHIQSLFQKLNVNGRAQAVSRGHVLSYLG
jgi:DNA-binding CsgD family transcriptional regulator